MLTLQEMCDRCIIPDLGFTRWGTWLETASSVTVMQKEGCVEEDGGQSAVTNFSHLKKKILILQ